MHVHLYLLYQHGSICTVLVKRTLHCDNDVCNDVADAAVFVIVYGLL